MIKFYISLLSSWITELKKTGGKIQVFTFNNVKIYDSLFHEKKPVKSLYISLCTVSFVTSSK